jgi:hypothetical protein
MPRLTQVEAMSMRFICWLLRASSQAPMASAFQRASMAAESAFIRVVARAALQQSSPEPLPTTWTAWAEAAAGRLSAPIARATTARAASILFMAQPPFDTSLL